MHVNSGDRALPKIAVVVASLGRPAVVSATLRQLLASQTLKPDAVIVSCVSPGDAGSAADLPSVTIVTGPAGSSRQRNAAFSVLPADIDIVVFFDDDFVADPDWLAAAARLFRDDGTIVGFTGQILADGIKGPGLSFEEALAILEAARSRPTASGIEPCSPYGCNMAFRMSAVGDLRFDERLVLYGWLEDRDFGARVAKGGGRLVRGAGARGVHMGIKLGRVSGDRFGYSQVVNPFYMMRKGTMPFRQAVVQVSKNIFINIARAPKPEPFIDRRGRLRGNFLGFRDVLRGNLAPERAAAIASRAVAKSPD